MTKREFIKKWNVAFESKEQELEFSVEMERDLNSVIKEKHILLSKYIQYIKILEGSDYILIHDERGIINMEFTPEEWETLRDIATSLEIETNP